MRAITKGAEPASLQAYRTVPGATYDGKDFTPIKSDIRTALVRDQHALCCYCMRRIASEDQARMKVEHWRPQRSHPALQLAWSNLLGACIGGMGLSLKDQTCDTRKGEDTITLNPLDPTHTSTLSCTSAGRLLSTNPQFQSDIDERLGLNHRILVEDRKARLDRHISSLQTRYPKQPIPLSAVQHLISETESPTEGKLREHACVFRLWARKRYRGQIS